jgi:hypothetical protein
MTTVERLNEILNSTRLRANSKTFVSSLFEQAKSRELSPKQMEYVDKFWEECFPAQDILDAEKEWLDFVTPEMRENLNIIGQYYEYHYANSKIAKNYKNADWFPDKALYEKNVESQWAKTTIKNYKAPARFSVGDTILFRDTQHNRSQYPRDWMDQPLLVLEVNKRVKENFITSYSVISLGHMEDQRTLEVKESNLNVYKRKKG